MSDNVCYVDAYARSVEARVLSVDPADPSLIVLDTTVFYPGGGGQPSDQGLFLRAADGRRWVVAGARKAGLDVVHQLDLGDSEPPSAGDLVEVELDWARRLMLMR